MCWHDFCSPELKNLILNFFKRRKMCAKEIQTETFITWIFLMTSLRQARHGGWFHAFQVFKPLMPEVLQHQPSNYNFNWIFIIPGLNTMLCGIWDLYLKITEQLFKGWTSFMSTNVKLRLRFDIHLAFTWRSPDIHLTFTWHSLDHLTTWPSSDLPLTLTKPLPDLDSLRLDLMLTWSLPGIHLTFTWP